MRAEFLDKIFNIAETDDRLVFMTADLGFGVVEKFAERFPDRFINVGVAEQAMIASATGLAEAGMIPYCYSIATFTSLRALEFTRNGPIAHGLPVKVVGVGAGMDYGFDGLTHFAIDDVSALRPYPGLLIWAPADAEEVTEDLEEIHNDPRPAYIRLLRRGIKSNNRRSDIESDGEFIGKSRYMCNRRKPSNYRRPWLSCLRGNSDKWIRRKGNPRWRRRVTNF
jgi:transketolase